jgi:hypothetical protein
MDLRTGPDETYTLGPREREPAVACADDSFDPPTGVAACIRSGGRLAPHGRGPAMVLDLAPHAGRSDGSQLENARRLTSRSPAIVRGSGRSNRDAVSALDVGA